MNEPKLRFKADDGSQFPDWKEKKIGELGIFTKGAPLSKADISDCGTPLILYGELYTTYNEVAYDIQRRTQSTVDEKYYSLVGDVVIPTSGETAEEISTATCVMAQNVILAGDLNIYRSDIVDGRIMSYILNHQAKWKIATLAQGKSIVYIQAAQLSDVAIKYPPSTVEQQKIAFLFTELDTLIQSAEKELEGYRELKEGMLQKMFPKKGEKVPEIRFPEFTGDWEQHKLGEVAPLRGGYAFKSDKYKTEGTPIVRISNILSDGSVGAEFAYYDDIEDDKKCTLGNGDALLAMSGATTGKVSILKCNNNDKYYQNQRVGYFERNEQYNYGFVSTIVRSDLFKEQLTLVLVAGAQPNVSSKEIDAFEFMFPNSIVEQKKIGEYFSNLDNLIALQQQELDGYKELKKGLLQQMFC
mgnify:FL=1